MFLLSVAGGAYEIAPASVVPLIREGLGIGPTAAGWLVSVMYATAVISSIPVGIILDRVNVRRAVTLAALGLLLAGVWGWVAGTASAFWWLIGSRILGGLAYVVFWNAGADLVGQAVDPDLRATAVSIFTASAPVGFALGQFGSPLVADTLGWPAIFPVYAAIAVVGVAVFLIATGGQSFRAATEAAVPDRAQFLSVFANRSVWILSTLCFLAFALYLFLNSWLPSYLTEELDMSLALAGTLTALFPAVGAVSRTSGGIISDRVFGGRRRPVVLTGFLGAAPAVGGFVFFTQVGVVIVLLLLSGLAIQLAIGLLFSYVTEVVAQEVTTTAVSIMTSVGLFGAFLAPIVAGEVIGRAGYQTAFIAGFVVAVFGILLAWYAPESV